MARVKPGKDIQTINPHLVAEWSPNNPLPPNEVSYGSDKKHLWVCSLGHEYLSSPNTRHFGRGCPFCAGKKILIGFNDLSTTHEQLSLEWSPNNKNKPTEVTMGSVKKVEWICSRGHLWVESVNNRTRGRGCPFCSGRRVLPGFNDLTTTHPHLVDEWSPNNTSNVSEHSKGSHNIVSWVCGKGHEWDSHIFNRTAHKSGCPLCKHPRELEFGLVEFVDSLGLEIIHNDREILKPKELDIYIPSKNIAIEFNGLYWHSDSVLKDKNYHYNKWKACHDQGIQLITVWEDDWLYRREIVARMLKHKLGVSEDQVVYARKCQVVVLPKQTAWEFLDGNHIQGHTFSSVYLGLTVGSELVAVMALTLNNKNTQEWTLDRYATSCGVPGGHSKLLKFFTKNYGWSQIVTFADLSVSDGSLYEKTGWRLDKILKPDYKYVVGGVRKHKFGYRIKRFRDDPSLKYVEGYTEYGLAKLNGLYRLWDCGKLRYVKTI